MKVINKFVAVLAAFSIGTSPVYADQYIFRYKTDYVSSQITPETPDEDFEIRANFIGYRGETFSQAIPLKGSQPVQYWQIVSGILPNGISFDATTGVLSGNPSQIQNTTLSALGYTSSGTDAVKAQIAFSVIAPDDKTVRVDGYGHVNRNVAVDVSPSGVTVERWTVNETLPSWLRLTGSMLQGIAPVGSEGVYSVNMTGYDYTGSEVANARGTVLIENGPNVAFIADRTVNIQTAVRVVPSVKRSLGVITWALEGDALPRGLSVDTGGAINGSISQFNTSARVRYIARDIDGTTGYSNYFVIAARDPDTSIRNIPDQSLVLNQAYQLNLSATDLQGDKTWRLDTGELPEGITFNTTTGSFSGVPTKLEEKTGLVVSVSSSNGGSDTSNTFGMTVYPAPIVITGEQTHVRVGRAFSTSPLQVTGAIQPYSFKVSEGTSLPSGLTLNPSNGVISGNFGSVTSQVVSLELTDATERVSKPYSVGINSYNDLALTVSPAKTDVSRLQSLVSPVVTVAEQSVIPSKANPFGNYELTGQLPDGITFAKTNGRIYGSPTQEGIYGPYTITLTDGSGESAVSNSFQIEVGPRESIKLEANDITLAAYSTVNRLRAINVENSVGTTVFELDASSSALPEGITLTKDGYFTGKPVNVGIVENIVLKVTDSEKQTATSEPFKISVTPAQSINLEQTAFEWTANKAFTFSLKAINADNPVTYSLSNRQTLPSGVALSAAGALTGNIAATGQYKGLVSIVDQQDRTAQVEISVAVKSPMTIGLPTEHTLSRGEASTINPSVDSNIGEVTFTQSGTLPAGLVFDASNGSISGTPTTEGTWNNIVITGRDQAENVDSATTQIIVGKRKEITISYDFASPLVEGSATGLPKLPNEPTNAIGAVKYSVTGNLPAGIVFNTDSGAFSGTPTLSGVFNNIVVTGVDAEGSSSTTSAMTIRVEKGGVFKVSDVNLNVRVNDYINTPAAVVENGVAPYSFTAAPNKPASLEVNLVSGAITGRLTSAGVSTFNVNVSDSLGKTAIYKVNITVLGEVALSYPVSNETNQYSETSIIPTVTNIVGQPYYEIDNGNLPAGLTLDNRTGRITGMPEQIGTFGNIVVQVTDGGQSGSSQISNTFAITVGNRLALDIENEVDNIALVNNTYKLQAKAINAVGAVTWSITGTLPDGLSANSSGLISGTPTSLGEWTGITLRATDSQGATANKVINITAQADGNPLLLTTYAVKAKPGVPFASELPLVKNAIGEVTFSSPDLVAQGITIDPSTGAISGTVSNITKITGNIRVTDSTNRLTSEFITIDVVPSIRVSMREVIDTTVNADMNAVRPVVEYAVGKTEYALIGTLPVGLSMSASTGNISGRPTLIGESDALTIRITDATGDTVTTNPFKVVVHDNGVLPRLTYNPSQAYTVLNSFGNVTPNRYSTNKTGDKYTINKPLPSGLSFNEDTGVISGTLPVEAAGLHEGYIVTVKNLAEQTGDSNEFTLKILPGSRNGAYQAKTMVSRENKLVDFGLPEYDATKMYGDIKYTITNKSGGPTLLDVGVDENTGRVWATTKRANTNNSFNLTATDIMGATSVKYSINSLLMKVTYDSSYTLEVNEYGVTPEPKLENAEGDLKFELASGTLPAGVSLDEISGQFVGTPTTSGSTRLTVKATDKYGSTTSNSFVLVTQSTSVAAFTIPDQLNLTNRGIRIYTAEIPITGNTGEVDMSIEGPSDATSKVCAPNTCGNTSASAADKKVSPGRVIQLSMIVPIEFGETKTMKVTVGGYSTTWTISSEELKTTPNQIIIADSLDQKKSSTITTGLYLIDGINTNAPVTLIGGNNSDWRHCSSNGSNCSAYVKTGEIANNRYIQLRTTTSDSYKTNTPVTLKIGDMEAVWNVQTEDLNNTPVDFDFVAAVNLAPRQTPTSNIVYITGITEDADFKLTYKGNNPNYNTNSVHGIMIGNVRTRFTSSVITGKFKNNDRIYITGLADDANDSVTTYTLEVGELTKEYKITTRKLNMTPDDFNFADSFNMAPNSIKATVTNINGIPDPIPYRIEYHGNNPDYLTNTGHYVGQKNNPNKRFDASGVVTGTISTGSNLTIAGLANKEFDSESYYTITVGDVTKEYRLKTRSYNDTPNDFDFTNRTDIALGALVASNQVTLSGIPDSVPYEVTYHGTHSKYSTYASHGIVIGSTTVRFINGKTLTGTISNGTLRINGFAEETNDSESYYTIKIGSVTKEYRIRTKP